MMTAAGDPQPRPTFRLVLQAQPHATPAAVRLRRALKCLLRPFGLKVLQVEELAQGGADPGQAEPRQRP